MALDHVRRKDHLAPAHHHRPHEITMAAATTTTTTTTPTTPPPSHLDRVELGYHGSRTKLNVERPEL